MDFKSWMCPIQWTNLGTSLLVSNCATYHENYVSLIFHCLSVPHRHFYTLLLTTRWESANYTSHTLQQFLVTFCQGGGTSKRSEGGRKREASNFPLGHQKQPWQWLAVAIVAVGYSHTWLQPPGRVAAAPPQQFQQHSSDAGSSSGKLAASWSLGIASSFFCSFTTTYLLCFALPSKNQFPALNLFCVKYLRWFLFSWLDPG